MFRSRTNYFIQCDKCGKLYRLTDESLSHIVSGNRHSAGDVARSPFRDNLSKLSVYDGWKWIKPDKHLCPECSDKELKNE